MQIKWSEHEDIVKFIAELMVEGADFASISTAIENKFGIKVTTSMVSGIASRRRLKQRKASISKQVISGELQKRIKEQNVGIKEKVIEAFGQYAKKLPPPKPPKPHKKTKRDRETAVAVMSDTQIGQSTPFKHTLGITEYSFEIFKHRLQRHLKAIISINEVHSAAVPVDELFLLLDGDMVEGETVFRGQQAHIELDATRQIVFGSREIANFINALCGVFTKVTVICVRGNHGRIGMKGDALGNLDDIFYFMVRHQLTNKNLDFYISESMAAIVEIEDHTFAVAHGDNVRGWMGLPYYGAERATRRIADITDIGLDYVIFGHHHQSANIPVGFTRVLFNGAYPGGSEFSVGKLHSASYPMQKFFYVHKRIGITSESDINLDPGNRGIIVPPTGPIRTPVNKI